MTARIEKSDELSAWDLYFSASLEHSKSGLTAQPANTYAQRLASNAASLADEMLKQRRARDKT